DRDAPHAACATRSSTARMIAPTEDMSNPLFSGSFALKGTEMSKASSIAKIDSTSPRLSMPRSSSVISGFTSATSRTACSAMIAITLSLTLIVIPALLRLSLPRVCNSRAKGRHLLEKPRQPADVLPRPDMGLHLHRRVAQQHPPRRHVRADLRAAPADRAISRDYA